MNTEPVALETVVCGRCETVCDAGDNFCRHCGLALADSRLPVRSNAGLPAVWQPRLRAIAIKGATFIAAGTVAEVLARRMVRRALSPFAKKAPTKSAARPVNVLEPDGGASGEDAQLVSETFLLRRIRIRR